MRRSSVYPAEQMTKRKNTFEIRNPQLNGVPFLLEATSREDLQDWMDAIQVRHDGMAALLSCTCHAGCLHGVCLHLACL